MNNDIFDKWSLKIQRALSQLGLKIQQINVDPMLDRWSLKIQRSLGQIGRIIGLERLIR